MVTAPPRLPGIPWANSRPVSPWSAAAEATWASGAPAQAVAALVSLGYNTSDAAQAVARIDEDLPVQEIIKIALRSLSRT